MRDEAAPQLWQVGIFLAAIWAVFLFAPLETVQQYGLLPREKAGAAGILTMPFLHGSLLHVAANTFTMGVILFQRAMIPFPGMWTTTAFMAVATGALIWLIHPDTNGVPIVGASGLAFALLAHAVVSSPNVIGFALLGVQAWFFWDLWVMMLTPNDLGVSWVGHWCGIAVGAWVGIARGTSI